MRELAAIAGVSEGVLRGLANQGVIEPVTVAIDRRFVPANPDFEQPELTDDQRAVADRLIEAGRTRQFAPFLLAGETGSRTSECYFSPKYEALERKRVESGQRGSERV